VCRLGILVNSLYRKNITLIQKRSAAVGPTCQVRLDDRHSLANTQKYVLKQQLCQFA